MFNDQDNGTVDCKLTFFGSVTVKSNQTTVNGLSNEKNVDDELNKNTFLRHNQPLS